MTLITPYLDDQEGPYLQHVQRRNTRVEHRIITFNKLAFQIARVLRHTVGTFRKEALSLRSETMGPQCRVTCKLMGLIMPCCPCGFKQAFTKVAHIRLDTEVHETYSFNSTNDALQLITWNTPQSQPNCISFIEWRHFWGKKNSASKRWIIK